MNIVQQIEAQAELYRVTLGLRTWDDQRAWAVAAYRQRIENYGDLPNSEGPERQSGRTMRDVLLALAACAVTGIVDVKLAATRSAVLDSIRIRFEDAIDKLKLDIVIHRPTAKRSKPHILYVDHYEAR